jgi:hypothetical protein
MPFTNDICVGLPETCLQIIVWSIKLRVFFTLLSVLSLFIAAKTWRKLEFRGVVGMRETYVLLCENEGTQKV